MKTDQELQQLFPKLLPGKVFWNTGLEKLYWIKQPAFPMRQGWVIETELLSLCRMVEEAFTQAGKVDHLNALRAILTKEYNRAISDFDLLHASWQQRIQAAAKVKGIV